MKFKTLVLQKENITDFAAERNIILKKTKSDWVFFLDSDEKASMELLFEISNLSPKATQGYFLRRKNYFLNQFVGTDKILRLGKKGAGKWQRIVHETWKIEGKKEILKNHLIHQTADGLKEYIAKMNLYSTLHALANQKEGKRSCILRIVFFPAVVFFSTLLKSKNTVFSIMASLHSFLSWSKLYLIQNKK